MFFFNAVLLLDRLGQIRERTLAVDLSKICVANSGGAKSIGCSMKLDETEHVLI